jgi:outer membrane protein OmpA-like peptidoglycan-associated protein
LSAFRVDADALDGVLVSRARAAQPAPRRGRRPRTTRELGDPLVAARAPARRVARAAVEPDGLPARPVPPADEFPPTVTRPVEVEAVDRSERVEDLPVHPPRSSPRRSRAIGAWLLVAAAASSFGILAAVSVRGSSLHGAAVAAHDPGPSRAHTDEVARPATAKALEPSHQETSSSLERSSQKASPSLEQSGATAAGASAAPATELDAGEGWTETYPATFRNGSRTPSVSSPAEVERLVAAIRECTGVATITGHTSDVGRRDYNLRLGRERAQRVQEQLEAAGIERDRMRATSAGPDRPIADNSTSAGEAANRRVTITCE